MAAGIKFGGPSAALEPRVEGECSVGRGGDSSSYCSTTKTRTEAEAHSPVRLSFRPCCTVVLRSDGRQLSSSAGRATTEVGQLFEQV